MSANRSPSKEKTDEKKEKQDSGKTTSETVKGNQIKQKEHKHAGKEIGNDCQSGCDKEENVTKGLKKAPMQDSSNNAVSENECKESGKKMEKRTFRIKSKQDLELLWTTMKEEWELDIPKLMISVTGGAKRFNITAKHKQIIKKSLMNAASVSGAWIITGGMATGVMKFVGEAVRDHIVTKGTSDKNIVALGIATWGCVANREKLDRDNQVVNIGNRKETGNEQEVPLDENHTHFILVDNGSRMKYGAEIEIVAKLVKFISKVSLNKNIKTQEEIAEKQSEDLLVPMVTIVVEGGVNTMESVCESVKNDIPVLVLQGSGRAADFIAFGYNLSKDKDELPKDFDEKLIKEAEIVFEWKPKDEIEKTKIIKTCVRRLKRILKKRKMISVFNLDEADTKDIDRAILDAILKAKKSSLEAQLELALVCNLSDIAKNEILTRRNQEQWKTICLENYMFKALLQDRADFVQLFLDCGVSFTQFLTIKRLYELYSDESWADVCRRRVDKLLTETERKKFCDRICCRWPENAEEDNQSAGKEKYNAKELNMLDSVGKFILHLLGDEKMNPFSEDEFHVKDEKAEQNGTKGNHDKMNQAEGNQQHSLCYCFSKDTGKLKRRLRYTDFKHPEKQLFLWAILFNKIEVAELLWKMTKNQIGGALVACALLKRLAVKAAADEELELSVNLQKHSQKYEDMATAVLGECYRKDKQLAHQLLVRPLNSYGNTTLFTLADDHELMNFMGHACCQTKLNLIWKGRMAQYTQSWLIFVSTIIPIMILKIKFRKEKEIDQQSEEMATENKTKQYTDASGSKTSQNKHGKDRKEKEVEQQPGKMLAKNMIKPYTDVSGSQTSQNKHGKDRKEKEVEQQPGKMDSKNNIKSNNGASGSKTSQNKHDKDRFSKVGIFTETSKNKICIFSAVYCFYTAPITVFIIHNISYLIFLAIFTYFVLTDLYPSRPSVLEYITWGWSVTMFIEEFRQVAARDEQMIRFKIRSWIRSIWNQFDLLMYMFFLVSVITRCALNENQFPWARNTYSITLAMYYLRFMQVFFVEKHMGPKVIMIKNMIVDLMFFVLIFAIFLLSFGVAYQANLFPNSEPSWYLLKSIVYMPYWQMYGELSLDEMESKPQDGCVSNETIWRAAGGQGRCPADTVLVPLLGAIYMILTNILLINLLIAMFSYTFQKVQEQSENVWRFYRFSLVHEYYDRPFWCPPLIIVIHLYKFIKYVYQKSRCVIHNSHNQFKLELREKEDNHLTLFEKSALEEYFSFSQRLELETVDKKVTTTHERLERVIEDLDNIKENLSKRNDSAGSVSPLLSFCYQVHTDDKEDTQKEMHIHLNEPRNQVAQIMQMLQQILRNQERNMRTSYLEISDISPSTDA